MPRSPIFLHLTLPLPPPDPLPLPPSRVDHEALGVPQKTVYDSIGVCIARDDFKNDIREVLAELLRDEVPCQLLMRTAIVASMSLNDIRRFVLSEVIPNLLKKQVWANSKSKVIWDGVCHFVKKFATNKDAEQTLRCLLGLHGAQLKVVLRVAPTAKAPLGKTLKALSAAEKEDVLSGRWAGIDISSKAGETAKLDAEKAKIVKECLSEAEKPVTSGK